MLGQVVSVCHKKTPTNQADFFDSATTDKQLKTSLYDLVVRML
jgi:hypothetical protein